MLEPDWEKQDGRTYWLYCSLSREGVLTPLALSSSALSQSSRSSEANSTPSSCKDIAQILFQKQFFFRQDRLQTQKASPLLCFPGLQGPSIGYPYLPFNQQLQVMGDSFLGLHNRIDQTPPDTNSSPLAINHLCFVYKNKSEYKQHTNAFKINKWNVNLEQVFCRYTIQIYRYT